MDVVHANTKFLDNVNQLLHNAGILFEKRIDIMLELLHGTFVNTPLEVREPLLDVLRAVSLSKEELFQRVFMFYGSKYLKKEFDQFYTPLTIGEFLCSLCEPNKKLIDPACGTGDLAIHYKGDITLWDISKEVTQLAEQNYKFQGKSATIRTLDSIQLNSECNGTYDYAIVNPPFGTKTVVTNPDILKNYELGKGKKKQELGILFVERSMNLLKPNGLLFIILPNGYFGNTSNSYVELRNYILRHHVTAIVKLPQNTFKRSGTGVSTNVLILKKSAPPTPNYDIFIEEVAEIGYELNKKNTPYKYKKNKSEYVLDVNGNPILHNDLYEVSERLKGNGNRQVLQTSLLDETCVLDISRYLNNYTNIVANASGKNAIRDLLEENYTCTFQKHNENEYTYIDIKEINTPLHNGKTMLGHALPSRAKYRVKKHDILVSRLKGNIAFTVIVEDNENLVCTNGVCVLRPKDTESMLILFAGLLSPEFRIQHQSLTTGSIMESISDDDVKNIIIPSVVDKGRYQRILDSIRILQTELY